MNTLEMLHLRMAGEDLDDLVELVRKVTDPPGGSAAVNIFRHSRVQGDLLIHLYWDRPDQGDQPSELGLRLASLLRKHGLVEHSVWVSAEPCAGGNQAFVHRENRI
jgi:hypothetical protein